MFAQFKGSGKETRAYIAKSYRLKKGDKTSTIIVESLGPLSEIAKEYPDVDPRQWVRDRAKELTRREKEESNIVSIELNPALSIRKDAAQKVRGGMLPLIPLFHQWMGLDRICKEIAGKYNFKYDLCQVLEMLVYGRVISPASKLATLRKAQNFINIPKFSLDSVYDALSILSRESDMLQAQIFHNTSAAAPRDTSVIYYDCSNYYFEIEREDEDFIDSNGHLVEGLKKYGHSKENRPNPIVQLGLFMDRDCMPLAFCVNPGNTPETKTIVPLEEKLANNFDLSTFVCCTDGGLGSREVRQYNTTEGREYITVQSLKDKKIDPVVQAWALEDAGWRIPEHDGEFTIEEARGILGDKFIDTTLYKDRWYKVGKKQFEEHYIVTYSQKYADYQRTTRNEQIQRALKKIERGESAKPKSPNDCRRFIHTEHSTRDGEVAEITVCGIDDEKVKSEARFDGLYAIATSLDDTPGAILKANHMRYVIESLFRITKTDLELRPIYLRRKDRIIGHFIICFIALLMVTRLQVLLDGKYTIEQILECLRSMDYKFFEANGYVPTFDRTALTDDIKALLEQRIDAQIITKPTMRAIIRQLSKC